MGESIQCARLHDPDCLSDHRSSELKCSIQDCPCTDDDDDDDQAFIAAGIYLTLKHFVIAFGREHSLIRPQLYTWIFICADISSLVLQGIGGGISAAGSINTARIGTDMALAGICFQVVALVIFGALASLYVAKVWFNRHQLSSEAQTLANSYKFQMFAVAIALAYLTVLTRCCYRIAELSGGWRNAVFRNETDFIVLDGVMMTMASLALTILHPGFFFPQLSAPFRMRAKEERRAQIPASSGLSDSGVEEGKVAEQSG